MFGKVSRDKISVTLPSRVNKVIVVQYGGTVLCYAIAYEKKFMQARSWIFNQTIHLWIGQREEEK